ncbi:MAG TPA: efflux RND transporter periplasmic adaptor subunit [Planctomycetota bacterium]|nr:efflux RND transporter periplasmic adaptor subunit [Planctomycetota bacterium]
MNRPAKALVLVAALLVCSAGAVAWRLERRDPKEVFRTSKVRRADIVSTISATGTVVPEDVVDVGAQVNGMIASFGVDTTGHVVDYRSTVEEGHVLARIDDSLYSADVATANAQLAQSKAQIELSEANRDQAKAHFDQTERDWARAQTLGSSRALARADYDAARSNYEQAKASVSVAEASIVQAHASVEMATAALKRAKQNLDYCTIASPVNGVIIDRRVEIGQTVVASLNAPSLFLIAKDLKRMQVLVQVNEADVGSVHPGQVVVFTVDAYPGQVFDGEVRKVRLNATMTQNVVTYTVEIVTDNADLRLLPYLTANVTFEVTRHDQVLAVPSAALRWTPHEGLVARDASDPPASLPASTPASGPDRGPGRSGRVWVLDGGRPKAVPVRVGITDSSLTEVDARELTEGADVVVGESSDTTRATPPGGASPFTPQLFRNRSR